MALATVVEDLEKIPEGLRVFYKQVDDKFILDADVESHPQVQGLRNAYRADHEKVKEQSASLAKFKDVDPLRWELLKDLKDEDLHALDTWRAEAARKTAGNGNKDITDFEIEFQKRIEPMKLANQREMDKRDNQLREAQAEKVALEKRMQQNLIQTAITAACAEAGVLPGAVEEIVLLGERSFRISDTGDITAVDRSGVETFGSDGKPMRPREWIASRGPEKAHWFPLNTGGGANGSRFNGDMRVNKRSDLRDIKSKVEFIKKYGQTAFEALPD